MIPPVGAAGKCREPFGPLVSSSRPCETLILKTRQVNFRENAWLVHPRSLRLLCKISRQVKSTVVTSEQLKMIRICYSGCQPSPPPRQKESHYCSYNTAEQTPAKLAYFASMPHFPTKPWWRSDHVLKNICPAVMVVSPPSVPCWVKSATAVSNTC